MLRRCLIALLLVASTNLVLAQSEPAAEYRAYWVETFNSPFATLTDVERIVDAAVQSNANALFMQVRRRGDAWYLDAAEPITEQPGFGQPDARGRPTFDPLRYLIEQAHARSIEVHAFVIVGSIYREDPAVRLPRDPSHVFLQHFWDSAANAPYKDARQWATRALPHNVTGTSHDGQRFGVEWYLDLGHPDAATYTINVLRHLVHRYELDGIHLDRIRYPEAPIDPGQGINVGYNATSVARFNARYARTGNPATTEALWHDWRREQVTSFVRRLYLNAKSIRPAIRVSAALIAFSSGPAANGGFERTEPYWRVFQDWESWSEEGILDLVAPMAYKREHVAAQQAQFDDWMRFTVKLARDSGLLSVIGLGAYINSIEGTLRQARRARNAGADGLLFYSLAGTNDDVSPNPFSYPTANQSTPLRPNSEFFAALKSGASMSGNVRFEPSGSESLFGRFVPPPSPPATSGHLMGVFDGSDGAHVTIENLTTGIRRTMRSDGSGFFGAVHLTPGLYRVSAIRDSRVLQACSVQVQAGIVAIASLSEGPCLPPPRIRRVSHQ